MIDTDKMRAAYAATPLAKGAWAVRSHVPSEPTRLCAISALIAFAGVQPDLIRKMAMIEDGSGGYVWVERFAAPVLAVEYGIPYVLISTIIHTFDRALGDLPESVAAVLRLCERENEAERSRGLLAVPTAVGAF